MSEDSEAEQQLLATLREALDEASQVPRSVIEAGYAAYTWRTIDSELAALSYDSSHEPAALVGARSQQAGLRSMTFASTSLTIELEFTSTIVLGQIIPAGPPGVLLRLEDETSRFIRVDEVGCFILDPAPQMGFRIQIAGPVNVSTDWIAL